MNFPNTNWTNWTSTDSEENSVLELFENRLFRQSIDFPTCSKNVLDVVFHQNCDVFSTNADDFTKVFNCSGHIVICSTIKLPHIAQNSTRELNWSFGSADFDTIASEMEQTPFLPTCFINIDNFYEELEEHLANLISRNVPSRTRHRQSPPSLDQTKHVTSVTKIRDPKKRLVLRHASYRKTFVAKMQNLVSELIEQDRKEYQNRLLGSRATRLIFKHLKSLKKDSNFAYEMEYDGRTPYKTQNQASF